MSVVGCDSVVPVRDVADGVLRRLLVASLAEPEICDDAYGPADVADVDAFVARARSDGTVAFVLFADGAAVGLVECVVVGGVGELNMWLLSCGRGRGLVSAGLRELLSVAPDRMSRLVASIWPSNWASIRVCVRAGAMFDGCSVWGDPPAPVLEYVWRFC